MERLRAGGHVYEQDGATWFRSTDLRRRQGPRHLPHRRRADLLRGGHRLRDREVQPRLRQAHLHLGRRPPRHRGPRAQRGRGDGLRQGGRGDAPGRLGALRARRPGGLDEQALRRVHHPRRAARGGRRRRGPLVVRATRASTPIDFDIELARKQSAENPVYYVQYAHARICSILRKAAEHGHRAGRHRSPEPSPATRSRPAWRARSCGCRRSSRTPRRPRRRRRVTAYATGPRHDVPRLLPRPARRRRRRPGDAPARRLALVDATRLALRNTLALLGISAPEQM